MGSVKNTKLYDVLRIEFQERFKVWCDIQNMTQVDIAKVMRRSKQQVHQLMTGRNMPSVTTINILASIIGVSPEKLFPTGRNDWRLEIKFHKKQTDIINIARAEFNRKK